MEIVLSRGKARVQLHHFTVTDYETCGNESAPCYHHANRISVKIGNTEQKVLLVGLAHPAAYGDPRRAKWLLGKRTSVGSQGCCSQQYFATLT